MNTTWYAASKEGVHIAKPSYAEALRWVASHGRTEWKVRHAPGWYEACVAGINYQIVRKDMVGEAHIDLDKWVELKAIR